jgi:hypothetical protein
LFELAHHQNKLHIDLLDFAVLIQLKAILPQCTGDQYKSQFLAALALQL